MVFDIAFIDEVSKWIDFFFCFEDSKIIDGLHNFFVLRSRKDL